MQLPRLPFVIALVGALGLACSSGPEEAPAQAPVEAAAPAVAPPPSAVAGPAAIPADYEWYQATPYDPVQLRAMTLWELSIRRNTLYARVGNPFAKKWLDTFFRAQSWYVPARSADLGSMPEIDRKNAALIGQVEAAFTQEELRERLSALVEERSVSGAERMGEIQTLEIDLLSAALGEYAGDPSIPVGQRNPLEDPNELARTLQPSQLTNLSRRDLRLLRNTIFARHGRAFTSELLQTYFAQKAWYVVDPKFTEARLTADDKANIALIVAEEGSRGGMLTDDEHQGELQAELFAGA